MEKEGSILTSALLRGADWRQQMNEVVATMRELSLATDPQEAVRAYAKRVTALTGFDGMISVSRRGLERPWYRITRASIWKDAIDPWKEPHRLPMFDRGLLGEFVYGEEPQIIDDLVISASDPAAEYFQGMRSVIAVPHFDSGQSLNFVVHMRREPGAFNRQDIPMVVWMSSLFGRATHNLVLSSDLREAYANLDHELKAVADMQRSLLPAELPNIPGMELAVHYQTSRYAGGDYYDFFELAGGKWGILIADVSGHGTPAAVIMAILHSIAHVAAREQQSPGAMLGLVNDRLTNGYTGGRGTFVTAFYGIYDPAERTITYACAGHNPPRVKRCSDGSVAALDQASGLPLGIEAEVNYTNHLERLSCGDIVLFYTDGITEAWSKSGEMFGIQRLEAVLDRCLASAQGTVNEVLAEVEFFSQGRAASDDRTLLAGQVE